MPTRRHLLKLALTVPAAELLGSALTARADGQEPTKEKAMASGTVMFADFEGGTWDGWKVEGDAFGTAPATDALFPGKMKGFGGKGFVCTFSPEKGYAATGKATSKEFTIEKPFITFKIGGGKFPGKACLNLVVGGEIVRTETGDGTGRFVDASWDVSDLTGKKAHFEIVDSTDSQQRGYVIVDDVLLCSNDFHRQSTESIFSTTDASLKRLNISSIFLDRYQPYLRMRQLGLNQNNFLGVSEKVRERLTDQICVIIYNGGARFRNGQTSKYIGLNIRKIVESVIGDSGISISRRFHQYLCAEACCAWMISNVFSDSDSTKMNPVTILKMNQPRAMCAGKAFTLIQISKATAEDIGLKCYYYAGWAKFPGSIQNIYESNHAWNLFEFDGGIALPADTLDIEKTNSLSSSLKTRHKIGDLHILPIKPSCTEYFLSCHFGIKKEPGHEQDYFEPKTIVEGLYGMDLLSWLRFDSSYASKLENLYPYVR